MADDRISRRHLIRSVTLGAAGAALARTASVTWAAAPPDWPQILTAAKKEGKVAVNTFPGFFPLLLSQ